MDDAVITLAAMAGLLKPPVPAWNPADPIAAWLAIGEANTWIKRAWDPPFNRRSFSACATVEGLKTQIQRINWCLGQAFHVGEICIIQQVDGGDEWLVIRRGIAFESASLGYMIKKGSFDAFWEDINAATDEELRSLRYGGAAGRARAMSA
jgi:hypothetical protein